MSILTSIGSVISKGIIVGALGIAAIFGYHAPAAATPVLGGVSSNPAVAAIFETSLAAPMGTSDTTLTLASTVIDANGDTLVNGQTYALTIDQGQPNQEFVQGTLFGSTLINLARGISPLTGTSTISNLAQTHRRGADVKITDWPTLGIINNQINGIETIPNPIFYAIDPSSTQWAAMSSTSLVDYAQLSRTAISGAVNSSESTNGIAQLSTGAQAALGTSVGSTGARLIIPASIATSTCQIVQNSVIIASTTTGKLDKGCFDQTASYTLTASTTLSATTTIAASGVSSAPIILNKIPYAFPASQSASSSALETDSNGNLSWEPLGFGRYTFATTTGAIGTSGNSIATSTGFSLPSGFLTASSSIISRGTLDCNKTGNTTATTCAYALRLSTGATIASWSVGVPADGAPGTNTDCNGSYVVTIYFNNALTSEIVFVQPTYYCTGGGNTTQSLAASVSTPSINLSGAITLVEVTLGSGESNSKANLDSYILEADK